MSALPAPEVPLQIEWQTAALQLSPAEQTQLVKKPRTALQNYIPGCDPTWQDTDSVTLADFFTEVQKYLHHRLQTELGRAHNALSLVQERQEAENALLRQALLFMKEQVHSVQTELRRYAERDELDEDRMEIEWTSPAIPPNYLEEIQRAITEGKLQILRPATPAPSRSSSRAATRTMQPRTGPFAAFPVRSRHRTVPLMMPQVGQSPMPPTQKRSAFSGLGLGYEEELYEEPLSPAPPPSANLGGRSWGPDAPSRSHSPAPPPPSQAPLPVAPEEPAGGSGGNPPPPPVASGAPGDDPDSSDSEPEGGDRKAWRKYLRKKLEKQQKDLFALMAAHIPASIPTHPPTATRGREPKAPPPSKFQGEAEQVETFLRQCENVFSIESQSFTADEIKIRYAGNLMEGTAAIRWYEAYHNSIDQAAANRIAGRPVRLDERWKKWVSFVDAFRTAFGEAISRDQAVVQWNTPKHTAREGIDSFLNSIVQLMWKTGYEGQLVDDKIQGSLLPELGLSWALFNPKPTSLMERIAALRELGHTHERYQLVAEKAPARAQKEPRSVISCQPKERKEAKRSSAPKETVGSKDSSVELKGIPSDILEERKKAEVCLKCGKSRHKWTTCWTKEPVTARVAAVTAKVQEPRKRKRGMGSRNKTREPSEKKAKVAAVVADEPLLVLPEVTEDFVFVPEKDSDDEIIW